MRFSADANRPLSAAYAPAPFVAREPVLVALQLLAALFLTSALANFRGLWTELAALLVQALLYANAAVLTVA